MNIQEFQANLFSAAQNYGFKDVEIYYEKKEVFGCQVYKGEIDQYEIAEDGGVSFRGIINEKMGYAYSEKIDEASIPFLLENAKENTQIMHDGDIEEIFAGSSQYEQGNFFSKALDEITISEKIQFIKDVERELLALDPRIVATDYCMIRTESVSRSLSNNKGLSLTDKMNYLYVIVEPIVKAGEETKTSFEFKVTKDFHRLDAKEIAKKAAEEALSQLGSRNIESKDYPVLLRNDAAASLLATYAPNFSAENTQAGISALRDKLGKQIAGGKITIVDDPFLEDGLASRTFDSEGVATKKLTLVESGVLQTFLHNQKTAKKEQTKTTGHAHKDSYKSAVKVGPSNLYIEPSTITFESLLASMDEGILITGLSGLHSGANTVSGDFSVAANGFYVADGKVQYPVNLMTIAGNFYQLLQNVKEIGSDLTFPLSPIGSPSVLVKSLSVTVE
ncbi:peptidase U62 modulator of DNA gyrase [Neobacillus bataviensis LMG 21833]|uniref:Peptidase U62 modulator of DNA gyrase n=1 Tax=Neobacillus bataviensis LMG 21833 TaxID=1117379 RepID=K6E302_9BACI|nr:TldD/PmbA family protein [Neobacillus bataviensis]EKN67566.1 peptidase U62 modulator of DNA gyrase [Neobacillus bataviensis LMG 21833]